MRNNSNNTTKNIAEMNAENENVALSGERVKNGKIQSGACVGLPGIKWKANKYGKDKVGLYVWGLWVL